MKLDHAAVAASAGPNFRPRLPLVPPRERSRRLVPERLVRLWVGCGGETAQGLDNLRLQVGSVGKGRVEDPGGEVADL